MPTAETTELLTNYTLPDGRTIEEVFVGTRSGRRVHAQTRGSSVTRCGHWQKASARYFVVDPSRVTPDMLCASCFPVAATTRLPKSAPQPVAAERRAARAADKAAKDAEKLARKIDRARKTVAKADAAIAKLGIDPAALESVYTEALVALPPTVFDVIRGDWGRAHGESRRATDDDARGFLIAQGLA